MLFNSYLYLLVFLPIVVAGFFLLQRYSLVRAGTYWLVLSSLFFYGFWNPIYVPLLLGSVVANYTLGTVVGKRKALSSLVTRGALIVGIVGNLGLLGFFKYADFFISNANAVTGATFPSLGLALPLAISFFTFQQIAYLVDSYRGIVEQHSLLRYTLFVTFFPQLIAGPIVHHREMMPQFADAKNRVVQYRHVFIGLFIITAGLFKKVVVADTFAIWASAGFDAAQHLTFFEAWVTSLSYTLQLYFDFSGYTDMAIGAALLLNIKLPLNFNSPYKAVNIQEFWRRWHITLSRFLRDYLYIPLGGNRHGDARTVGNVLTVFLLGGLWHGAGWTFVIWGGLHGLAVALFTLWRKLGIVLPKVVAWFITFQFVNAAWVFFRAESFADAFGVLKGMTGLSGISLPASWYAHAASSIEFEGAFPTLEFEHPFKVIAWIAVFLGVVLFSRNTMEWAKRLRPHLVVVAIMILFAAVSLYSMSSVSEFIYFNF